MIIIVFGAVQSRLRIYWFWRV